MAGKDKAKASGRKASKPAQKRYVAERRSEVNALRRAKRHEKRQAYFKARRAKGKRNAAHRPRGQKEPVLFF